jgi:hypothetical protein
MDWKAELEEFNQRMLAFHAAKLRADIAMPIAANR